MRMRSLNFKHFQKLLKEKEDIYRKLSETHYQRGYTVEEMKTLVEKAGFSIKEILDADTRKAPTAESERVYIVAGKAV